VVNERIKLLRKELGLSQVEFAERLGISDAAISKIESGKNTPAESTIRLICSTYKVLYQWLTTGEGEMFAYNEPSTDELVDKYMPNESEFARSIMKSFARLSDSEWIKLRDLIDQIRKEGHP